MIKCLKCREIIDTLIYHGVNIDELEPQVLIVGFKDQELICDDCEEPFEPKEYYFDSQADYDEFEAKALDCIADILSKKFDCCSHCRGSDLESFVNVCNKDIEDGEPEMSYYGTSVKDFLFDESVPDEYHDEILSRIRCQNCGHGGDIYHPKHNPDGGPFEMEDRFYTEKDIDDFYGVSYDEISLLAEEYGISLEKNEFLIFRDYIYENPMLAYRDLTGQKIYELLEKLYQDTNYHIVSVGTELYRGRTRSKDGEQLPSSKMWNPPVGQSSHGRYNLVGVSVLYCCDSIQGIPYEIHPQHDEVADMGTFVVKKDLKLLDVSDLFGNFVGFSEVNNESKILKKAYLLTNFIRDCCFAIGYNGVRYKGVGKGDYYNYAFFKFDKDEDLDVKDVKTVDYDIVYQQKRERT